MKNSIVKTNGWKTQGGLQVTVTATLKLRETINLDGDKIETNCCKKSLSIELESYGSQGDWIRTVDERVMSGCVIVAQVGKLALTQEHVDIINATEKEITDTPEWQAEEKRIEANRKANAEYEEHYAAVTRMMSY